MKLLIPKPIAKLIILPESVETNSILNVVLISLRFCGHVFINNIENYTAYHKTLYKYNYTIQIILQLVSFAHCLEIHSLLNVTAFYCMMSHFVFIHSSYLFMNIWAVFIPLIFQTMSQSTFLYSFPCARISLEYNLGSSISRSPGIGIRHLYIEQVSSNCSPKCLQRFILHPEACTYSSISL